MNAHDEMIDLSIVIPCYNERERLPETLCSIQAYLDHKRLASEILIVDDGSDDGTAEWVKEQALNDERVRALGYADNRGKGSAVKVGMLEAKGKYVLFTDADGSTPIGETDKILPLLESGSAEVVVGSRASRDSDIVESQSPLRRFAGDLFGMLARMLVLSGVSDTQCGFKAFTHSASHVVFSRIDNASAIFDIEVLILAVKNGYKVCEVPITWKHDGDTRIAYNALRSIMIFVELLKIKCRYGILWPIRIKKKK